MGADAYGSINPTNKPFSADVVIGIKNGRSAQRAPSQSPADPLLGAKKVHASSSSSKEEERRYTFFHYLIYAIINVIIAVPGLYGYSSVIFNNPAFQPHMAALSKLVIFSSFVHQFAFAMFSSLDFAIGTVQDAGLIFLSSMANSIANDILENGGTVDEVLSTTLVILPLGTASLGFVLILLGKFRLLDIVSYLPMVIGGYLAFIGYFCLEAGVALSISKSMTEITDWGYLFDPHLLLLATPGLVSALILTYISRKATNDAVLPIAMVMIPASFYAVLYLSGISLSEAREMGWVGEVSASVQFNDLLHLVDFSLVRWSLVTKCIGTWVGMVFVVSFASCLDIAAVSMDMGEALDTNKEMVTVGTSNLLSGLLFGFTGSYIFSQTIFTYRTGCHSRWIAVFIMISYLAVVASTVNVLQIAPLFFLGATLIFIGYDLLWEWLIEIRSKIFLMEYVILLVTFVAIQIIGMDFGILFGVVIALVDHVASTTRVSSLSRVIKRSRAVWSLEDWNVLQLHGYHGDHAKIATLEIKGSVFFGSAQKLLTEIMDDLGISMTQGEMKEIALSTPHSASSAMHNVDASAASSCFLQLAKLCEKRGIFLCAAGVLPRVEWMLRSHRVAFKFDEEVEIKKSMLSNDDGHWKQPVFGKLILFMTLYEALEFCERSLIRRVTNHVPHGRLSFLRIPTGDSQSPNSLESLVKTILGKDANLEEESLIDEITGYCEQVKYMAGEPIFRTNTHSDAFYIVVSGMVAVPKRLGSTKIISGAGVKDGRNLSSSNLMEFTAEGEDTQHTSTVESFHKVGNIFGFCDFLLERYRTFDAVAKGGTVLAKFTSADMERMKIENRPLYVVVQNMLLKASLMDLANCTCHA
ncbi:hypothetical protein ACHAWX_006272 [Stephanocyclus meneghinianus]